MKQLRKFYIYSRSSLYFLIFLAVSMLIAVIQLLIEDNFFENLFADSCFWTHHFRIIPLISCLRKLSVIVYKFFDVVSLCCVNIIWPIQENTLFKNFGKEIVSLIL